jgi:hypothetical protein
LPIGPFAEHCGYLAFCSGRGCLPGEDVTSEIAAVRIVKTVIAIRRLGKPEKRQR